MHLEEKAVDRDVVLTMIHEKRDGSWMKQGVVGDKLQVLHVLGCETGQRIA